MTFPLKTDPSRSLGLLPSTNRLCPTVNKQSPQCPSRHSIALRSFALTGRLLRLLDDFRDAGIDVLPLKGPVLSRILYNDPGLRDFEDLDLLVRRSDVPRSIELLENRGYKLNSELAWLPRDVLIRRNCALSFRRHCGTMVDLHWEVAPCDYPFRFDAELLWSSLGSIDIAGRRVPVLAPECQLLFLCMHGAKHLWTRVQWLRDVARLVEISPRLDWGRVLALAGANGGSHVVLLGLLLAHDVLDAPVPSRILSLAWDDRVIQPLAAQVKHRLDHDAPPPDSLQLVTFNAKMAERRLDKFRHVAALLKGPTEADARIVKLPPKLLFLYYPLRFVRLVLKYGFGVSS